MTACPLARLHALALAALSAVAAAACATRRVDLGENVVAAEPPDERVADVDPPVAVSQYGCDEWNDAEMYALREGACGGACDTVPALPYALESKKAVMSATAGRWSYCAGSLGPPGTVGMELAPGCRIFFLVRDASGAVARGTSAAAQASYDIVEPRGIGEARYIDVHLDETRTERFAVTAYRCPERLVLRGDEVSLDLAQGLGAPFDPTR